MSSDDIKLYVRSNENGSELDLITLLHMISTNLETAARKGLKGGLSPEAAADIIRTTESDIKAACAPYKRENDSGFASLFIYAAGLFLKQYKFILDFSESTIYEKYRGAFPDFESTLGQIAGSAELVSVSDEESVYSFLKSLEAAAPYIGKIESSSLTNFLEKYAGTPKISARKIDELYYPTDKLNNIFWSGRIAAAQKSSDGAYHIATGGSKDPDLIFDIDFPREEAALGNIENLNGVPVLDGLDKRIMIAANALFEQQGDIFSLNQLFRAMGHNRNIHAAEREGLKKRLDHFFCKMTLSNESEMQAGYKYPHVEYSGAVMPHERIVVIMDGIYTDAVRLLRKPPLMEFAEGRKQYKTLPADIFSLLPLSTTTATVTLEDYLLTRIAAMGGNHKLSRKILYSTIYKKVGAAGRMAQKRTREKTATILDGYKQSGLIAGYKKDTESRTPGVIISLKRSRKD